MGLPRKLKNFNLFVEGRGYQGEIDEVNLPKLMRKMDEHRAGGMVGPVKLDFGPKELEMEWTVSGWSPNLFDNWGASKHNAALLRFMGAVQSDDDEKVSALEVVARGRHEEIDTGKAKGGDKTEIKIKTALTYYKLTVDGKVIMELDFVNMVEIVNGKDLQAATRAAIGL
ncbi:phage major tail tube protein [Limnohabitans sp. WS1]|uniref:phage major tail tube protein n=1 Tax=Limnohabitans sp. WS1 TaxID=1100726 RepID=UPI000D39559F|nr:phage major tail tube protein [Limnohabitans sp. WS1]PUE20344.1 phage major tail tube protein [Limnohabitans sp. WS1]